MITLTVGQLLDRQVSNGQETDNIIVYVVREGDLVFYVGESVDVIGRLYSHVGQGSFGWAGYSELGHLIRDNLPVARTWQIELLTIEDCVSVLEKLTTLRLEVRLTGVYQLQEPLIQDGLTLQFAQRLDRKDLECELIQAYKPCLNSACNTNPTPLPEKYQRIYDHTRIELALSNVLNLDLESALRRDAARSKRKTSQH